MNANLLMPEKGDMLGKVLFSGLFAGDGPFLEQLLEISPRD